MKLFAPRTSARRCSFDRKMREQRARLQNKQALLRRQMQTTRSHSKETTSIDLLQIAQFLCLLSELENPMAKTEPARSKSLVRRCSNPGRRERLLIWILIWFAGISFSENLFPGAEAMEVQSNSKCFLFDDVDPEEERASRELITRKAVTVDRLFNCKSKRIGVNPGKICHTGEGERLFLKTILPGGYSKAKHNMDRSKEFRGILGTPRIRVVCEKGASYHEEGVCSLATKFNFDFVSAAKLSKIINRDEGREINLFSSRWRAKLVEHIGERGVAELAVASTFLYDMNLDNYGYQKGVKGIFIIDVDESVKTYNEYYNVMFQIGNFNPALSRNNIEQMQTIFERMLERGIKNPALRVGLTEDQHKRVFQHRIDTCKDVLMNTGNLQPGEPDRHINIAFLSAFRMYAPTPGSDSRSHSKSLGM